MVNKRENVSLCLFQWTVGGTKGKKKVKPGKGSEKKSASKKKVNKATASGSSDGDSSADSSAPEEGKIPDFLTKEGLKVKKKKVHLLNFDLLFGQLLRFQCR